MTQHALSERVKLSQSKISKFENGTLSPAAADLERIASALGYPTSFFFQCDAVYGLTSNCLHHRRQKKAAVKDLKVGHATINILRMQDESYSPLVR